MGYARWLGWLGLVLVMTGCSSEPTAPSPRGEGSGQDSVTSAVERAREPSLPPGVEVHGKLDHSDLTAILRLIGHGSDIPDLLGIWVEDSGEVLVRRGVIKDPKFGWGIDIRLRKIDGRWKLVSEEKWVA